MITNATFDFDILVVGTGPAGQRAAVAAAKLGKRVGIVERRHCTGGVCVNTGTIPSKTLREAILYLSGYRLRSVYGMNYRVKEHISMRDLTMRLSHVIRNEMQVINSQMNRNGIQLLTGHAEFDGPHCMLVHDGHGSVRVTANKFVLATGTIPARPEGVALVDGCIIDSDGLLQLDEIPRTMTVVGGGIIGLEYAAMFGLLGTKVTLVDQRPRLLEFVDTEIADHLVYHLRQQGLTLRLGEEVAFVEREAGQPVAMLSSGKRIRSEVLLFSTGRQGNTSGLNLSAVGIEPDARGRLTVDEHYRTGAGHVYAVGDVVGFPALASTSMEQGRLAALHACESAGFTIPGLYPYAIYTVPEISMVGRTEQDLTAAGIPFESGVANYREIARGQILGDESGMLKLVFHLETRQILGVHAIGEGAAELVHVGQAVMALGGTIDYFRDTVFNYPTLAECYKVAAYNGLNKL